MGEAKLEGRGSGGERRIIRLVQIPIQWESKYINWGLCSTRNVADLSKTIPHLCMYVEQAPTVCFGVDTRIVRSNPLPIIR